MGEDDLFGVESELDYFISRQEKLLQEYNGKVLVIKANDIVGVYNSELEAYLEAQKLYEPGTFMIQKCTPGPEAYTVTINHNCIQWV